MGTIVSSVLDALAYFTTTFASTLSGSPLKTQQPKTRDTMPYKLLVGSYTNSIYTLEFDPSKTSDSALTITTELDVGFHPSWVAKHPSDPSLFFTGLEQSDGRLLALKYNIATGEGKVVADVSSGGDSPCSLLAVENEVLVGNYMGGSVAIYSISSTLDSVGLKELQPVLKFAGTGPCSERQEMSHPHQVQQISREGAEDEILVPDLGADKIWRLVKNKGVYENAGSVSFDTHRGGGPRHVVVYDGVLYTVLELTNQLTAHLFPPLSTSASTPLLAASPTLSSAPDVPPLTMLAAELVLASPNSSFPTPYLYASTRNVPTPGGDVITIYSTVAVSSPSPTIPIVNEIETGLNHLRGFVLFGPDDRFLIAAGANGGGIKVFERVDEGKDLKELAHLTVKDGGHGLCPTSFVSLG